MQNPWSLTRSPRSSRLAGQDARVCRSNAGLQFRVLPSPAGVPSDHPAKYGDLTYKRRPHGFQSHQPSTHIRSRQPSTHKDPSLIRSIISLFVVPSFGLDSTTPVLKHSFRRDFHSFTGLGQAHSTYQTLSCPFVCLLIEFGIRYCRDRVKFHSISPTPDSKLTPLPRLLFLYLDLDTELGVRR